MEQQNVRNVGVTHRFSHNNLHILLPERFDPPQAEALIGLLKGNSSQCNRIFIDVRSVTQPHPTAVHALKTSLHVQGLDTDRVFFKGQCGFQLAVDGNCVLIAKQPHKEHGKDHVCKGNCAHCTCGHHAHEEHQ